MKNITKEYFESILADEVTKEIDNRVPLDELSPIISITNYGDDTNADIGWMGQDFNYAFSEGFYQIAHFSYSRLGLESDTLIYPIFFNYRHYIELSLKTFIQEFKLYYELPISTNVDHDIAKLLVSLCQILDNNNLSFMLPNEIRTVIKEFHDLDPKNIKYRYAHAQNGDLSHEYKEKLISLKHLHFVMNTIHNYFFSITCLFDEVDKPSQVGTLFEPFLKKILGLKLSKDLLKHLREISDEITIDPENVVKFSVESNSINDNNQDLICCSIIIEENQKVHLFCEAQLNYKINNENIKMLKSVQIKTKKN